LVQLSENPVEGVCGRSLFGKQEIFRAVFSNSFFRLKLTLKSYNSKGIYSIALKFGRQVV